MNFHERTPSEDLGGDVIAARLQAQFQAEIQDGLVQVFGAPPVDGLGTAGGFKLVMEDRGDSEFATLQSVGEKIVQRGSQTEGLQGLFCSFRADTPWLFLDIDRLQAKDAGRVDERGFQHAPGLPGLVLRERFQSFRPDMAGERAGGCCVSRA